jgi:hypothetical protein
MLKLFNINYNNNILVFKTVKVKKINFILGISTSTAFLVYC